MARKKKKTKANISEILKVSQLRVEFDRKVVIPNLSFVLEEEQSLVILGPNGAGKTVLLRSLLGLLPYQGVISWKSGLKLGYVPQRVPLNRDLPVSVEDFFTLKNTARNHSLELLKEVGISDALFLNQQLGTLSSGQFQRVLIAWALSNDPDVLLFDEPTAGIDIEGEETIHTLLHKTQQERKLSVILVTHDLSTVYGRATHVLCMNNKIFCYGPPKEILNSETLRKIYGTDIKLFEYIHD